MRLALVIGLGLMLCGSSCQKEPDVTQNITGSCNTCIISTGGSGDGSDASATSPTPQPIIVTPSNP